MTIFWLDAAPEPHPRVDWVILTSPSFPPIAAPIAADEEFLLFLPDARPLDADTFHIHPYTAPPPAQASN